MAKTRDEKEEFSKKDKETIRQLPTYQPPVRPVKYNPAPLEDDKQPKRPEEGK
jgi:hypothetical protein